MCVCASTIHTYRDRVCRHAYTHTCIYSHHYQLIYFFFDIFRSSRQGTDRGGIWGAAMVRLCCRRRYVMHFLICNLYVHICVCIFLCACFFSSCTLRRIPLERLLTLHTYSKTNTHIHICIYIYTHTNSHTHTRAAAILYIGGYVAKIAGKAIEEVEAESEANRHREGDTSQMKQSVVTSTTNKTLWEGVWSHGSIHGSEDDHMGASMAQRMITWEHPWLRGWSHGSIHGLEDDHMGSSMA
jgi:hypothetical protein